MHPKNTTIRFPEEGVALIPLDHTGDKWASVSLCDVETVLPYPWSLRGGYARAIVDGTHMAMHRLVMDAPAAVIIDHINGDTLDNRRDNLRFANKSLNAANTGLKASNKTGFKGVRRAARGERWVAFIGAGGKYRHLGTFDTVVQAAKAYDVAAAEVYGEHAHLNFPPDKKTA